MDATTQLMTAEELLKLSHGRNRYELIEGELKTEDPAGAEHGRIVMRSSWRLAQPVEVSNSGETFGAVKEF